MSDYEVTDYGEVHLVFMCNGEVVEPPIYWRDIGGGENE